MRWIPTIALIALIVLVLPFWRWSRGWGYTPAAMIGVGLLTVLLFTFSVVSE